MEVKANSKTAIKFKRVLKVGILTGLIAGVLIMLIIMGITIAVKNKSHNKEVKELKTQIKQLEETVAVQAEEDLIKIEDAAVQLASDSDDWCLALINEDYLLAESYVPELAEVEEGFEVDARIKEAVEDMFAAAQEDGLSLVLRSAYRSYETQDTYFNSDMQSWISSGYDPLDAYNTTIQSVALPGSSEHVAGLALDIVSASYDGLDEAQEETEEAKWLMKHCAEYGFILRYPSDKTDITGITYEPWHYRYVGVDAAKEIMEQGITLEEYVGAK